MDLKGSLVDCKLRIYPSEKLANFLETLTIENDTPANLLKFIKGKTELNSSQNKDPKPVAIHLSNKDIKNLNAIKEIINKIDSTKSIKSNSDSESSEKDSIENNISAEEVIESLDNNSNDNENAVNTEQTATKKILDKETKSGDIPSAKENLEQETKDEDIPTAKKEGPFLTPADVDWLFIDLGKRRSNGENNIPYVHELLQGSSVEMPENKIIKRNPVLEARCVKLRAQQEAREYRQMTKGVDNVRIRFPDDSIAYQLKQVNRQLIAIGQFIISIFAGFLFGFKGVEWMIGNLDFGFRLLLGVMCALVIALAEIYFLAKKLSEELNVPETVQLGGPPKFVDETKNGYTSKSVNKEHQD